jgi:hypothetical protein
MNNNYILRDTIIFGKYEPESYLGGCKRFTCSRDTILKLLELDFIDPEECQNCSPTTKEFIECTEDFKDALFNCYAISDKRDDYRITIEGLDIEVQDDEYDKISYLVETFHYADEFSFEHNGDSYFLHAWWD